MCLPGTVETVREGIENEREEPGREGVSRRAALAGLKNIPPRGAHLVVGVIPWEEGSGGPCRLLAAY